MLRLGTLWLHSIKHTHTWTTKQTSWGITVSSVCFCRNLPVSVFYGLFFEK